MSTFLWFYVAGLAAALVVGIVLYCVLGAYCGPMLAKLFGEHPGQLWGRTFRMMLVMSAVVGGLSTQWYGCEGYTDYKRLEKDRRAMFEKSTGQVASAMVYARNFLIVAAGIGAITFGFLWRGRPEPANSPLIQNQHERAATPSAGRET